MSQTRTKFIVLFLGVFLAIVLMSCSEDTPYDQRTVMIVSSINDNTPFFSDVLNQGDSLYERDGVTYKTNDDYVVEDYLPVTFYNKPYSSIFETENSSLGDFLVTNYDVEFVRLDGGTSPVPSFSGETSVLVPANSTVEANILLVPFSVKNQSPLYDLRYSPDEIITYAHITFHGHEVQTNRNISFETGVTVTFGDKLQVKGNEEY